MLTEIRQRLGQMVPPLVSTIYTDLIRRVQTEISSLQESELTGTTVDDWVEHYLSSYGMRPISLLDETPLIQGRVEKVPVRDVFGDTVVIEQDLTLVALAVEAEPGIKQLLQMRASTWYSMNPVNMKYEDGRIVVAVRDSKPEIVSEELKRAKDCIHYLNADIQSGNAKLREVIEEHIKIRMGQVGARTQRFQSLADALGFELVPSAGTQRRLHDAPRMREGIARIRRPQPQRGASPRLDPEIFKVIIEVIDAQGITFERTPDTVAKLGEEDIRNLILGALNGSFNMDATGEAFSNQGKTDIRIAVPDGGVFIAEAKIWGGPSTIAQATQQILGYLTWRDAYGVVLLFSRNERFSQVCAAIPAAIQQESLRGEVRQVDDHHWSARHVLPGDDGATVEIHYLLYNIFTPKVAKQP